MSQHIQIIAQVQRDWSCVLDELDLHALRTAFADLVDQAAEAVFRKGLDLDDVVLRHMLQCNAGDERGVLVEARWLSDADRLTADVRAAFDSASLSQIRVTGLSVKAVLDT